MTFRPLPVRGPRPSIGSAAHRVGRAVSTAARAVLARRDRAAVDPAEGLPVDLVWRRRVVLAGLASAAVVAVGMFPHVGPVASLTTPVLLVGLAAWLVELLATPTSRVPEALLLLVVGACGAALNAVAPQSSGFVLAYFAVAGLGLRFPTRTAALLGVLVVGTVDLGVALASSQVATSVTTSDLGLAFVFMVAAATRSARAADARSRWLVGELERSRAAQAASAALAERARLAREIHDILAHSLSGQVMSLEAARLLAERTSTEDRVVTEIERALRLAKSGLADTRRAIGALRGDPLPGPELIPELVEEAAVVHGLRARLTVTGTPRHVPVDTGLCLYRTAQEALTNTAKHAGRGASSDLTLVWEDDRVLLTVADHRRNGTRHDPSAGSVLPSGGYGLTGLRERAELADGSLEATPTPTGFLVRLTLPLTTTIRSSGGV